MIDASTTITPTTYHVDPQHRAIADQILTHCGIDKDETTEIWVGAKQAVIHIRKVVDLPPDLDVAQWATFDAPRSAK